MSYILEALRKSQQDRELGRVPTLATQPLFTPRESSRNSWLGIALGLAALAVAIALYAVLRARSETAPGGLAPMGVQVPAQSPAQTVASAQPSAAGPAGAPPAAPPGPMAVVAPPAATVEPPSPSPTTARVEPSPVAPGSGAVPAGQAAHPVTSSIPEEAEVDPEVPPYAPYPPHSGGPAEPQPSYPPPAPPAPPAREATRPSPADAIPEDLREDIEAFKDQIKGGQGGKSASKAKASAAQQQVPLRERRLPPEVQERLPTFLLTVHLYDADPEKRLVIIDGRRLRQGDATRSGILVEEIFPDGVALAFEGHRFFQPR